MNKAEIRAIRDQTTKSISKWISRIAPEQENPQNTLNHISEAALTAAQAAGDKAGYERGWDEGVEACICPVCRGAGTTPGAAEGNNTCFECKGRGTQKANEIRRLKKGQND